MKKQQKHYTPEEKVAILGRHLVEGEPISDLCDELGLQPAAFMLAGHQQEIQAGRDWKLEAARGQRKNRRQSVA